MSKLVNTSAPAWVCLLVAFLAFSGATYAADPVARVVVASGKVTAEGTEGPRDLKRRSEVYVGESVLTGPQARTQLRFSDGALVTVEPASELLIEAYRHNSSEPGESRALLKMVTGGLRSITGAIAEEYPQGYEVTTPLASIGVRGTDFQLELSPSRLTVGVWDGVVAVENEFGNLVIGPEQPYRFTTVRPNEAPEGVLETPKELLSYHGGQADDSESPEEELRAVDQRSPGEPGQRTAAPAETTPTGALQQWAMLAEAMPAQQSSDVERYVSEETDLIPDPDTGAIVAELPEWFLPQQQRTLPTVFTILTNPEAEFATQEFSYSQRGAGMLGTNDTGLALSGNGNISISSGAVTSDYAYILPQLSASSATKVPDFPVYWGKWDNSPSLIANNETVNSDGSFSLSDYNVSQGEMVQSLLGFAYSTAEPLSLSQINDILPGTQRLAFDSGFGFSTGTVLDSFFTSGELDPSRSFINFEVDLTTTTSILTNANYRFAVIGDGFEQIWTVDAQGMQFSQANLSNQAQDSVGHLPNVTLFFRSLVFDESEAILFPDANVVAIGGGYIIPSDGQQDQLGFFGSIDLQASEGESTEMTILERGTVNFVIGEAQ